MISEGAGTSLLLHDLNNLLFKNQYFTTVPESCYSTKENCCKYRIRRSVLAYRRQRSNACRVLEAIFWQIQIPIKM
uniref:Uncharacterized protein n=1 Tax=Anguilla anguilla TaxID=7936 RepID=A0A0E9WTQ0_ANGAN